MPSIRHHSFSFLSLCGIDGYMNGLYHRCWERSCISLLSTLSFVEYDALYSATFTAVNTKADVKVS